jgi:DNA polymerase III epsilon subunit-like protein
MEQSLFGQVETESDRAALRDLIFLDTETTGTEIGKDRVCQVCFMQNGELHTAYFKPPFAIPIKAMSVHHITNRMVETMPVFIGSTYAHDLQSRLETGILVAHNAGFDIGMLATEKVHVPRHICTYRVAFFLDRESAIPEYNLQYLRYHLDLQVEAVAHDAEGDVKVLHALFGWLMQNMMHEYQNEWQAIEAMLAISAKPMLFRKFNFGKYKDAAIVDIARTDKGYLEWLLAQKQKNPAGEEDWIFTLQHYLA